MSPESPTRRTCAQMVVHELLVETQPEYRARRLEAEGVTRESIASGEAMRVMEQLVTLPVVVHVVYQTPEQNVSDEQVTSQIEALNRDFRARNEDKDKVPAGWQSLVSDANIEFALATTDPDGAATSGITRTATAVEAFRPDDTVKSSATGGADPWPADRYVNLWVCSLVSRLLGYAQFPGGPAATDGVVILNTAFGTLGTALDPFDNGRTATHEVGHFLGLRHIWGDKNDCSGDDFVADTPRAKEANQGRRSSRTSRATTARTGTCS